MWKLFSNLLSTADRIIGSTLSNIINKNVNQGAGVGGFELSIHSLTPAKIKSKSQISMATYAPFVSILVYTLSDYLRVRHFEKQFQQLENDKAAIGTGIKYCKTELKHIELIKKFPDTHQQIWHFFSNNNEKDENELVVDLPPDLDKVIERVSNPYSYWEEFVKYFTTGIDVTAGLLSMGSILINYVVPAVLNNDFENEEANNSALVLGTLFAIYAAYLAVLNAKKSWFLLKENRENVIQSVNQFCTLYQNIPAEYQTDELNQALNKWKMQA